MQYMRNKKIESVDSYFYYEKIKREFLRLLDKYTNCFFAEREFEKFLDKIPCGCVINTKRNGSFEKMKDNCFRTIGLSRFFTILPEMIYKIIEYEVDGMKAPYILDINQFPIRAHYYEKDCKCVEATINKVLSKAESNNQYLGIDDVYFIWNGQWADPYVCYKDYVTNIYDLDEFCQELYDYDVKRGLVKKAGRAVPDDFIFNNSKEVKDFIKKKGKHVKGICDWAKSMSADEMKKHTVKYNPKAFPKPYGDNTFEKRVFSRRFK